MGKGGSLEYSITTLHLTIRVAQLGPVTKQGKLAGSQCRANFGLHNLFYLIEVEQDTLYPVYQRVVPSASLNSMSSMFV